MSQRTRSKHVNVLEDVSYCSVNWGIRYDPGTRRNRNKNTKAVWRIGVARRVTRKLKSIAEKRKSGANKRACEIVTAVRARWPRSIRDADARPPCFCSAPLRNTAAGRRRCRRLPWGWRRPSGRIGITRERKADWKSRFCFFEKYPIFPRRRFICFDRLPNTVAVAVTHTRVDRTTLFFRRALYDGSRHETRDLVRWPNRRYIFKRANPRRRATRHTGTTSSLNINIFIICEHVCVCMWTI